MKLSFYKCEICGKLIALISDSNVPTFCCGEAMHEVMPNTIDASKEKHVPATVSSDSSILIHIGSEAHPMLNAHSIEWIGLSTANGFQIRKLSPGDLPQTVFTFTKSDIPEKAYAYCNLHGLWCKDLQTSR